MPPLEEIQHARLLVGAVGAIDELGYAQATVAHITERACVSRRTFYELFSNREECLAAVFEDVVARVGRELTACTLEELSWRERVRTGLSAILSFFDREPALARLCVIHALGAGPRVLERREELIGVLARVVDEGRREGARGAQCTQLVAEGLVGAAVAIVHARLQRRSREPLAALLGELMALIVLPYLGAAASRREQLRTPPALPTPLSDSGRKTDVASRAGDESLRAMPIRLTYRTARVLTGVDEHPGASNRSIAAYAGIADQGQISKLLMRLERAGLLANSGLGHAKGERNAWSLTPRGQQLVRSIRAPMVRQAVGA